MNSQFVTDPMSALASTSCVFIKQIFEWAEVLTGYETPNIYQVYYRPPGSPYTCLLFSCKEMSGCCERQYCHGHQRPLEMHIKHAQSLNFNGMDFGQDNFAVFDKPYAFQCYCCCRPSMTGHYSNMNGAIFGSVTEPWTYCDPVFQVRNNNGPAYSITTNCCTCGYLCGNGCGCFEPVIFPIFKGEECDSSKLENSVGKIVKHGMGFQSLISDADNFEIMFPIDATPEDKLMLIGAALMIDYSLFEENPRQNRSHHHF